MSCGADDEMVVLHAHVHDPFSEVEIIIHFMKAIVDTDLVLCVQSGFDVGPLDLPVDDVSEDDLSISSGACESGSVVAP